MKNQRPAYLFRVGVVHGELQAATRQALKDLRASAGLTAYVPDCESYTVFAYTIAEALLSAAHQIDKPGMYTLVSNPAWSWSDLHQYLAARAGVPQPTALLEQPRENKSAGWKRRLQQSLFGMLRTRKEFLNGYIGSVSSTLEQLMRATYHMRSAAAEISLGHLENRYKPCFENFSVYPGKRLKGISDSRNTMGEPLRKLQQIVATVANSPVESATARTTI